MSPVFSLSFFCLFFLFFGVLYRSATGAEPQVLPAANRVDLSSQLSAAPAGTVGLSCDQRPSSRPRLPTLLAVSL